VVRQVEKAQEQKFFGSFFQKRTGLVLLCLVLWLPGFFALPPTDRDESRFALATRQMIDTGDYVRIMNGAVPRNKKPIGIYWLQVPFAAAARAAGLATQNPIWPYRIPSLLGGILAVLATAAIGRTLFPGGRAAPLAGVMLAASVALSYETHLAKTDAALLGATTLAMAVLARAWAGHHIGRRAAALFWLALGAGILIKGPITPLVVVLAGTAASLAGRRVGWLAALRPAWGVPLAAIVVLPWFIAIGIETHGAFFAEAVGGDLGRKLGGGDESHGAPPGFHLLLMPLLVFPGTLPVVLGVAAAWLRRREPAIVFLLAWLLPAWLVFEAVPTKLPNYTLPLYPALCLLAADAASRLAPPLAARLAPHAKALLACVAAALAGATLAVPPLLGASPWLGVPAAVCALATGAVAWRLGPWAASPAAVLLYAAILQLELPGLDPVWIAPRATTALRAAWPAVPPDGAGVLAVGYAEPSLMFLVGPRLRFLPNGKQAARAWSAAPHGAALIAAPEVGAFIATAARGGIAATAAATIDGFDYARGRTVRLQLFVRR
jgi:4-amino-4-deoxy-L-arabinose transferase-like glycosyltransferase